MAHSGDFRARDITAEWHGHELLARVCEHAGLTNREAQVALLHYAGKLPHEVAKVLRVPWKEVWRSQRKANEKLRRAYPRLGQLAEQMQNLDTDQKRAMWVAYQNKRSFSDHGPLLGQDERKNVYSVGGGACMASAAHFGAGHITPLDVLELLLLEIHEKESKASLEKIPAVA